ncbi:hypothetical protein JM93_01343 [Roseibium hamelinense]|uniref:Uncharacterized protein n=1 Tax=Roseibium hamelinense TaxID=150831 RepID=A0A562T9U7_9HYPH|nr:hypothetical protein JM93_01343 [Roseibium hamelinense]
MPADFSSVKKVMNMLSKLPPGNEAVECALEAVASLFRLLIWNFHIWRYRWGRSDEDLTMQRSVLRTCISPVVRAQSRTALFLRKPLGVCIFSHVSNKTYGFTRLTTGPSRGAEATC